MQNGSCPHMLTQKTFIKCLVKFQCTLALPQKNYINQSEFILVLWKLPSELWECLGDPQWAVMLLCQTPSQWRAGRSSCMEELTLFTCESSKCYFHCIYCPDWKLQANSCWHQVWERYVRSPTSCKRRGNASSGAAPCVEAQHFSGNCKEDSSFVVMHSCTLQVSSSLFHSSFQ